MTTARLVEAESPGGIDALARLMGCVPRPVILVGFVRPYKDLHARLIDEGVNLQDVFFIDATPHPQLEEFRPDAFFVGSPTLLEKVAIVCSKVLPRIGGKAHIILHDYGGVETYNGAGMSRQFLHQMRSQAGHDGCDLDVLIAAPAPSDLCAVVDACVGIEEVAK